MDKFYYYLVYLSFAAILLIVPIIAYFVDKMRYRKIMKEFNYIAGQNDGENT